MKSTLKYLQSLNLTEKDIEVYLSMVKFGVGRVSEIAREVDIPRQTTYSILQKLVELDLLEQHDKQGVKTFSADPRQLLKIVERQKEQLLYQAREVEKELPELTALRYRSAQIPKVQYYEGKEGIKKLLQEILQQHAQGVKMFRGYGINRFKEVIDDYLYTFVKKRAEYGVETNLFIGRGDDDFGITSPANAYGRTVKRLNMPPQKAGCYIVGEKIYLFSYENRVGIMIEDRAMAELFTAIFEDHWDKTR